MSVSGGLDRALFRGREAGCQVIQIFTRNTTRWASRKLSPSDIDAFYAARQETSVEPVAAHDSYLINLASPKSEVREKSFSAFLEEMERAERLEIPYLVMHPGAHLGEGEATGLRRIIEAFNRVHDQTPDFRVQILIETTAGQGTNLGYRFEQIAEILEGLEAQDRMGVCLDTCHVFAAGYDFRTYKTYSELIKSFDSVIGLNRLKLIHVNDAKKGLGSRVDRHEHLGQGLIGRDAFSFFLKDPMFEKIPFLLETPKGRNKDGIEWDILNLELLRRLMKEGIRK